MNDNKQKLEELARNQFLVKGDLFHRKEFVALNPNSSITVDDGTGRHISVPLNQKEFEKMAEELKKKGIY